VPPLLPPIPDRAAYAASQGGTAPWLAAMQAICARHGLDPAGLERVNEGSNVVFASGGAIIKLYPPHYQALFATELAVTRHVAGRLPVATPAVLGQGALEGWSYLVITRMQGIYLRDVWATLPAADQQGIAAQMGALLAAFHGLPTAPLAGLTDTWPEFITGRVAECVAHHRAHGVADSWLRQMPAFLSAAEPLVPPGYASVLLNNDLHQWHLRAAQEGGAWHLTGLFDFDDARLGYYQYDFATTGLFLLAGRPDLWRAFLGAYGGPVVADRAMGRRLLAYTLLHRYRDFNWLRATFVPAFQGTTLEELAAAIYTFHEEV
jgi:hygromycin-B 7''-O-kinase